MKRSSLGMCAHSAVPRGGCLAIFAAAVALLPSTLAAQLLNSGDSVSRVDSSGTPWDADYGFDLASSAVLFDDSFLFTPEGTWPAPSRELYSHARVAANAGATMTYTLATAAYGTYNLRLHFCELDLSVGEAGLRVFDVAVNGVTVLSSLDIVESFGWATPAAIDLNVDVDSSLLTVELGGVQGSQMPAILSGLELERAAETCANSSLTCLELGWGFRHGNSICSESIISGVCNTGNFTNAVDTCRAVAGGRLCSVAELQSNAAGGSGCGFDSAAVWTSDGCSGGGRITMAGSTSSSATFPPTCVSTSSTASVRCCADTVACPAPVITTTTGEPETTTTVSVTTATTMTATTTTECPEQSARSCADLMLEDTDTNNLRDPWRITTPPEVCGMSPQIEVLNGSVMEYHCVKSSLPGPNGYVSFIPVAPCYAMTGQISFSKMKHNRSKGQFFFAMIEWYPF